MGKIFSAIFGGSGSNSKSQQTAQSTSQNNSASWNDAYPQLSNDYGSQTSNGLGANDFMAQLLGLKGDAGANDAFDKYKQDAGYNFMLDSGSKAITNNSASKGILNSGATLKALSDYGQNTGTSFFNNYLDKLSGLGQQGLGAGGLIASTGQKSVGSGTSNSSSQGTSNASSYSKPGMGQFIGSIISGAAASDPRLKTDIHPVGANDGLTVYDFRYVWDPEGTVRRGYMADEVALTYPEALGPELPGGYKTIYYDKLPKIEGVG